VWPVSARLHSASGVREVIFSRSRGAQQVVVPSGLDDLPDIARRSPEVQRRRLRWRHLQRALFGRRRASSRRADSPGLDRFDDARHCRPPIESGYAFSPASARRRASTSASGASSVRTMPASSAIPTAHQGTPGNAGRPCSRKARTRARSSGSLQEARRRRTRSRRASSSPRAAGGGVPAFEIAEDAAIWRADGPPHRSGAALPPLPPAAREGRAEDLVRLLRAPERAVGQQLDQQVAHGVAQRAADVLG